MKLITVTIVGIAGLLFLYFLLDHFWSPKTLGEIKIPSIPRESCLKHNSEKHMERTSKELEQGQRAYFAGGCFWCTESDFQKVPGVAEVISGYAGGHVADPTYSDVTSEKSGHRETVEVYYDPAKVSYRDLVRYYLMHIDPTDAGGQFYDRGESYQSVIFYQSEDERVIAIQSIQELEEAKIFDRPLAVRVLPYTNFYSAEAYHQNYSEQNTTKYCAYRESSGRDAFLKKYFENKTWEDVVGSTHRQGAEEHRDLSREIDFSRYVKPSEEELKKTLSDLEYKVTQEGETEKPFDNAYNQNYESGIYVDIVSGEPLFLSSDKYDSGTGWPSFVKPISAEYISEKEDWSLWGVRTEVRSKYGDNHLGHVFSDGPKDRGGRRYCMNSAALRFVPKKSMESEGYGRFLLLLGS